MMMDRLSEIMESGKHGKIYVIGHNQFDRKLISLDPEMTLYIDAAGTEPLAEE
jgi:hypothetical protein